MIFYREASSQRVGMILAFGSLVWAGTFNALAKGLTPYLSPASLLLISEALTGLFIVLTFGIVPLFRACVRMPKRTILMAAFVGILNSALAPFLWFYGLAQTTAINASMLSSTEMLCILVVGSLVLHERVSRMQILGACIVFFGVCILQLSMNGTVHLALHAGDAFVVAGAIVSGLGAILFKKYLSHVMPEVAILIRNISGFTLALLVAISFEHPFLEEVTSFPLAKVLLLLAFAFFSRYLNLTCYYEAMDRLPAVTVSLIQIATPLSGVIFASLILGESLTMIQVLGGTFILFGLAIEQASDVTLHRLRHPSLISWISHFHHRSPSHPVASGLSPKVV